MIVEIFDHQGHMYSFSNETVVPRIGDTVSVDNSPFLEVTGISWVYYKTPWAGIGVPPTRVVVMTKLKFSEKKRKWWK